ncbi:hypothetical protein [Caulobacter hibisci]|uniref:Uncharacterized protein n=1 Tax=Caulobacter hibisci TaxID=2035993 RepID=A0ABS0SZI4_9CAUL|nr:hypothetical protein [Caulobacter hibisci]MBI1684073.1 hypothetical protein [Caulobacter hibisci]
MIDAASAANGDQTATLEFKGGPVGFRAEVRLTPKGILAIGGLVTGVLLSTAVLVWTATSVARRPPLATRILPR